MRYEFQKQSPDHEVLEQNPSWENSKVNDTLLKFYGNKVIQATPKTLSVYTQYSKNLVGENALTYLSY